MTIYPPYNNIALQLGSVSLHWYGVLIASAILISYLLAEREAKRNKIDIGAFDGIFLITVIGGIIGARIGFIIQNLTYYSANLKEIFYIYDGGLSIHGALILGCVSLLLASKFYKTDFFRLANLLAPFTLLSGAIGRWGNFFNQEIIGKPTNSLIKLFVSEEGRPDGFQNINYFHPVFLYESVLLLLAFIIYLILRKKMHDRAFIYTLVSYSAIRIVVEGFRIDYKPIFMGLDLAQLVSFGIILITVVIGLTFRKK